jgi:hypothetical protein
VPIDERHELAFAMTPGADSSSNAALVRSDVLVLLRERRYEEALAVLYRARAESPGSSELQKSIDQIKEFLIGAYAKRLGGLDQVAKPIPPNVVRSPDVVLVSRYIDGASTLGDVAQMSPLGQLRTLQVLLGLYSKPEASFAIEAELPRSGRRLLDGLTGQSVPAPLIELAEPPPPDTARSAEIISVAPPVETDEARQYRETFALGTSAFIQRRYDDAVQAFEACAQLRPGDSAAAVMLRRTLRDLESR